MTTGLDIIARELRQATGASRVTIRGPQSPGEVGTALLAESLENGIESMADAPQTGIAEAPTYTYLRTHKKPLLQNDTTQDPLPPTMLTDRYRVRAQMLGPLLDGEHLTGTVSVHQVGHTRIWTTTDLTALIHAVKAVTSFLENPSDSTESAQA